MGITDITRPHRWDAKVDRLTTPDGCWPWRGWRNAAGYGGFMWAPGVRITAHRAGYRLLVGEIPEGYEIDHLCRNRSCVRPDHVRAVTVAENRATRLVARGLQKIQGRKTHCPQGHPYSGPNLYRKDTPSGTQRVCRECTRAAKRRYLQRRRDAGLPSHPERHPGG